MTMAGLLEGKVAFITGAARGQGRAHAVALAKEGADIIAIDICRTVEKVQYPGATPQDLAETVRLVEALDRRIVASQVDVRDTAGVQQAVDEGVATLGRLDIVVANAGISVLEPVLDTSDETWETTIGVNLTGVFKTVRATAPPHIIAGGEGGFDRDHLLKRRAQAQSQPGSYAASKAGVTMLMQVLALELAPHWIRVNTVHPTVVHTPMIHNEYKYKVFRPELDHPPTRADFEVAAAGLNRLPIAGVEVEDVAAAVLYLVGDASRYVTGTTLFVDGGAQL